MTATGAPIACPCCGRETNTPHCGHRECSWLRCVCGARIRRDGSHASEATKSGPAHGLTHLRCKRKATT